MAAVLIAGALGLHACATSHAVNVPLAQAHDLTAFLGDRDSAIKSMQSAAVMEYAGGGEHFKVRENLVIRRPAGMRVEVMSALGVALVVAADAGRAAVFDPGKNTLMRGAANAAALERYARIPMAPDAAVRLLLALPPDSAMLAYRPYAMTENGEGRVLTYHQPGGAVDELGFTGDGNLEMVRATLADGRVDYEVHYSGYRRLNGGIWFPAEVAASFPRTGARVTLRYENPALNLEVPDSIFVLAPGAGTRKLDLGMELVEHRTSAG